MIDTWGRFSESYNLSNRIISLSQLLMSNIDKAPEWAVYFALDQDGTGHFFKDKPVYDKSLGNRWFPTEDKNKVCAYSITTIEGLQNFVDIWDKSLINIKQKPDKVDIFDWLEEIQVQEVEPNKYNNNLETEYWVTNSDNLLLGKFTDETLANMFRLAYINMQMNNPNDDYM